MTPSGIILVCISSALWLLLSPILATATIRRLGLFRSNFLQQNIPGSYGLIILFWTPVAAVLLRLTGLFNSRGLYSLTAAVLCFGLLGFVDDLYGDRSVGGLRGHFRRLFSERRITTGLLKAVGGAAAGVAIARAILNVSWPIAVLDGAIIALAANAINLLDLRPGRACAVFLVLAACLVAFEWATRETITPLWLVVIPALVVYPKDYKAEAMLGDTGSNLLGSALGVSMVVGIQSVSVKIAILGCFVLFHVVSESSSITAIIENNAPLRKLDAFTGRRR